MTEASLNGSTNMEGKAPLLDKSGLISPFWFMFVSFIG